MTHENEAQPTSEGGRGIGRGGTVARVLLGFVLLGGAVVFGTNGGLQWREVALGLVAAPAALLAWQLIRLRWTTGQLDATGPIGFCLNCAIAAIFFSVDYTRDAALVFYGGSMLLAAVRGYAGCEVLAIGNWILRRDDQVGCVVFSPLDAVEERVTGVSASSP